MLINNPLHKISPSPISHAKLHQVFNCISCSNYSGMYWYLKKSVQLMKAYKKTKNLQQQLSRDHIVWCNSKYTSKLYKTWVNIFSTILSENLTWHATIDFILSRKFFKKNHHQQLIENIFFNQQINTMLNWRQTWFFENHHES